MDTNTFPREYTGLYSENDIYIDCYKNVRIYHYGNRTLMAYIPSIGRGHNIIKTIQGELGNDIIYNIEVDCENNIYKKAFFIVFVSVLHFARMCYWHSIGRKKGADKAKIMARANWNAVKALMSSKTPREIFIKFYLELKSQKTVSVK